MNTITNATTSANTSLTLNFSDTTASRYFTGDIRIRPETRMSSLFRQMRSAFRQGRLLDATSLSDEEIADIIALYPMLSESTMFDPIRSEAAARGIVATALQPSYIKQQPGRPKWPPHLKDTESDHRGTCKNCGRRRALYQDDLCRTCFAQTKEHLRHTKNKKEKTKEKTLKDWAQALYGLSVPEEEPKPSKASNIHFKNFRRFAAKSCPSCLSRGFTFSFQRCATCQGEGLVYDRLNLSNQTKQGKHHLPKLSELQTHSTISKKRRKVTEKKQERKQEKKQIERRGWSNEYDRNSDTNSGRDSGYRIDARRVVSKKRRGEDKTAGRDGRNGFRSEFEKRGGGLTGVCMRGMHSNCTGNVLTWAGEGEDAVVVGREPCQCRCHKLKNQYGERKGFKSRTAREPSFNEIADDISDRAQEAESRVTSTLSTVANKHRGHLLGLGQRVKGRDSLLRKIQAIGRERGIGPVEAGAEVSDALRYTVAFGPDEYTHGVREVLADLKMYGHRPRSDRFRNFWTSSNDPYQGINVIMEDTSRGLSWELQFHTDDSYAVKESTHGDYELLRSSTNNTERKAAWDRLVSASGELSYPKGVLSLGVPAEFALAG